jgi:hypothetical protein
MPMTLSETGLLHTSVGNSALVFNKIYNNIDCRLMLLFFFTLYLYKSHIQRFVTKEKLPWFLRKWASLHDPSMGINKIALFDLLDLCSAYFVEPLLVYQVIWW